MKIESSEDQEHSILVQDEEENTYRVRLEEPVCPRCQLGRETQQHMTHQCVHAQRDKEEHHQQVKKLWKESWKEAHYKIFQRFEPLPESMFWFDPTDTEVTTWEEDRWCYNRSGLGGEIPALNTHLPKSAVPFWKQITQFPRTLGALGFWPKKASKQFWTEIFANTTNSLKNT